ncbi:unnamed protein product [Penicillium olsonii]|uniref:AB hydrolase-1 domain-containing protein n=1 Tax=Penicillium olsonii TaxID=99116 RepID=A0A9W4HXB2_PENOL|nr:unnamed protein product [Penicillium olsonii]CAG7929664.1 unnamed protein product [Penicillium olsonii]CAG8155201.1 unnamed protein product [Penicillium olsonii]CAG8210938.1 unnamed protein product [Penicillium olsonii]
MRLNENSAPVQAESALLSRRRRRKSMPSRNGDPTSPEVISSLISSLSAISVPLNSHFDTVPKIDTDSEPGLPEVPRTAPVYSVPPSEQHGFGMSYGAYKPTTEPPEPPAPFLHPDDAASSPVIRMARAPPSPKSPRSPRFKPFRSDSTRPASRDSFASTIAPEEASFGTISTEPGPRLSAAPSIASTSSAGRARSLKGPFGLLKKSSSREFSTERDPQIERLRRTISHNDGLRHNVPRSRASLRSLHSMAEVNEESRPADLKEDMFEEKAGTPPTHDLQSLHTPDAGSPGGIGSGRIIPTRDSSVRHRHSQSSGSRKHRSTRHSRFPSTASKESAAANGLPGTSNDAEQVTKRIQELKDQQQKIKTELEADNSPESSAKTTPVKSVKPKISKASRVLGHDVNQALIHDGPRDCPPLEESAPSPSVMTGKSRGTRPGPPLSSKSTNLPPLLPKMSGERPESERARYRRSLEPVAPIQHRRTPSGHLSHVSHVSNGRRSFSTERPSSADSIDLAVDDYIFSPKLTQRVTHPTSGRSIAFSEVGDPKGHVVLCCVGMGLTRYLMAFYDELARTLNLRLVTLDRPGVGESGPHQVDEPNAPLNWPDDVAIVCNHLRVTKFSILAHSAGAIYALATALRIPQHIRGRIHLLAPWIPPSQLSTLGSQKDPAPSNAVPYTQKILRALPTSLLKVANSSFMTATSASITASLPKSPRRSKRKTAKEANNPIVPQIPPIETNFHREETLPDIKSSVVTTSHHKSDTTLALRAKSSEEEIERKRDYDTRLTYKIWERATMNANPSVDLLICLERRQTIGFRYVDITRSVVIHHGRKDPRVPVENVQWLGKTMRRCEVRILEGEGHGLMASAGVMGNVLTEIAREWEDWTTLVQGKRRTNHARPGLSIQT